MINAAKAGRCSDGLGETEKSKVCRACTKFFGMDASHKDVFMLPKFHQAEQVRQTLKVTMWGSRPSWESMAWEQGYMGSFRAGVCGTRVVACTDGLMLLKFRG